MAKVNIAGIAIDTEAHRGNTPAEHEAIFAHLQGSAKAQAVRDFKKAMEDGKPKLKAADSQPKETDEVTKNKK